MKNTAVEWLEEQLNSYGNMTFNEFLTLGQYDIKKQELFEQAKEMEKQQIIDAVDGHPLFARPFEGVDYYDEVYKK